MLIKLSEIVRLVGNIFIRYSLLDGNNNYIASFGQLTPEYISFTVVERFLMYIFHMFKRWIKMNVEFPGTVRC